jgi:hypothetical protein
MFSGRGGRNDGFKGIGLGLPGKVHHFLEPVLKRDKENMVLPLDEIQGGTLPPGRGWGFRGFS